VIDAVLLDTVASSRTALVPAVKYAGVTGSADDSAGRARRLPSGRSRRNPAGMSSPATHSTAFPRVNRVAAQSVTCSGVRVYVPNSVNAASP
jgi:hypothetical protein